MKSEELLKKMDKFGKSYYTAADIAKISGQSRLSVLVKLNRLVKTGRILRLRRDCYVSAGQSIDYELIAQQMDPLCYTSFESALSYYGILSQVPYVLTLATGGRSGTIKLGGRQIVYRSIKKELAFGYQKDGRIKLATPEKALWDLVYLVSRGQSDFNFQELDLDKLDSGKLQDLAGEFPEYTRKLFQTFYALT